MAQNFGVNAMPSFTNVKVPQEFNPHEGCDPSGIRSIQLRGDRVAIANANQIWYILLQIMGAIINANNLLFLACTQ